MILYSLRPTTVYSFCSSSFLEEIIVDFLKTIVLVKLCNINLQYFWQYTLYIDQYYLPPHSNSLSVPVGKGTGLVFQGHVFDSHRKSWYCSSIFCNWYYWVLQIIDTRNFTVTIFLDYGFSPVRLHSYFRKCWNDENVCQNSLS